MTTQSKSAQNSEQTHAQAPTKQTPAELLNDLECDVAELGNHLNLTPYECALKELLRNIHNCDHMLSLYQQIKDKESNAHPIGHYQTQAQAPKSRPLADIIKEQNQQRGLEPLPLDAELLLKRVADGGHSGQFLADAFISAYRTDIPFQHSLGELNKLDAEGFRLFHQVLHIRHIQGWNDGRLYQIEQQINAIVGGVA